MYKNISQSEKAKLRTTYKKTYNFVPLKDESAAMWLKEIRSDDVPTRTSYWEAPVINIFGVGGVLKTVTGYCGVDIKEIRSKSRKREVTECRSLCCYFLFKLLNRKSKYGFRAYTLKKIGEDVNRDHATVLHSLRKVNEWVETDKNFEQKINDLEKIFLIK